MGYQFVTGDRAKQGSKDWLAWRSAGLGASDAPAVMGRSKWLTPYGLWRIKRGMDTVALNPAMKRGIQLEPKARAAYESHTGNIMVPVIVESLEHPILRASLDGFDPTVNIPLEIKCPGAEAHQLAVNGIVPEYYVDQCQQQLLITGAPKMHYWSFDGENGALVVVYADQARQQEIIEKSHAFWDLVLSGKWSTDQWDAAAMHWRHIKMQMEALEQAEESARKGLIAMLQPGEDKKEGAGVIVTRSNRTGSVDYKKALETKGIVLTEQEMEQFRGKSSSTVSIRIAATADPVNVDVLTSFSTPKPAQAAEEELDKSMQDFVLVI